MFSHRYWNWASVQISEYLFGGGGGWAMGLGEGLLAVLNYTHLVRAVISQVS